jgi:coiled-coil domain-containing protein 55
MTHFYAKLLQDSEKDHEATVAATSKATQGPQGPAPNLTIVKPPTLALRSDIELAREAREEGKDVELNDDNQLVDKRELLSAGLNLSAPNTRKLGLSSRTRKEGGDPVEAAAHRAVGTAASRREIQERRMREIQDQMEEEEHRMVEVKERAAAEAKARIVARRNDSDSVQGAKERYLARKRRKLEEGEAIPLGGEDG